jgi:hypothetical protein
MLLEAADTSEFLDIQARSTHQNPVNFFRNQKTSDICALYATSVQNASGGGYFFRALVDVVVG